MRLPSTKGITAAAAAAGILILSCAELAPTFGDEPGLFSRIFRSSGSNANPSPNPASSSSPAGNGSSMTGQPLFTGQPALSTPNSTSAGSTVAPAVRPKPRISKPVTEADPLVTRVSIGRSDNGSHFSMFLEVFADGTVIDGEGVHHVSAEVLKPVFDAVASGELAKLKGHCGGAAGDFIETVHVIAFDRSLGRLRANSFSFSGNPQGCDHAVHHLQKVLDDIQAKVSPTSPANVTQNANNVPQTPTPNPISPTLELTTP